MKSKVTSVWEIIPIPIADDTQIQLFGQDLSLPGLDSWDISSGPSNFT